MASRECPTCCVEYDSQEHRILILHCGHSQCKACMKAQYSNGQITCAACQATHIYSDFSNIPVCYVAEKIWEDMDENKNKENPQGENYIIPQAPVLHKGVCAEHGTFKLFWCNTHQEWICTHCSVIDHPRGVCDIVTIRKKLESDKHVTESNISEELMYLQNTKKEVENSIDEVKKETEEERDQIKKIKDEMEKMKMSISQKEKGIEVFNAQKSKLEAISTECTQRKSTLENIITCLHKVRNFKEHDAESGKSSTIINKNVVWREELKKKQGIALVEILGKLKKEINTQQQNAMIQEAKKILRKVINGNAMYATKIIENVKHYCLIEEKEGGIFLNELQKNLVPDSNSMYFEFDLLHSIVPEAPLVFLELSIGGIVKGRVLMRLEKDNPKLRNHILKIVTGQQGKSLAGTQTNHHRDYLYIPSLSSFKDMPLTPICNEIMNAKEGEVTVEFADGHLHKMYFVVGMRNFYGKKCVMGRIESGIDVLRHCHSNTGSGVTITKCGLVIPFE